MKYNFCVYFLIDYDNLGLQNVDEIKTTIEHSISILFQKIELLKNKNIEFKIRLYGGWDELLINEGMLSNNASKKAQELSSYIEETYPKVVDYKDYFYSIYVELVHSLAIRPDKPYYYTFRKRQTLKNIYICKEDECCCDKARNALSFFRELVKKKKCCDCNIDSNKLVWVTEQKLVDEMLAMDLSYYAQNDLDDKNSIIVIMSDDDDFLPVIFQAGYLGKNIYHIKQNLSHCSKHYIEMNSPRDKYIKIDF